MALAHLSPEMLDEALPGDLDLPCSDGEPMENPHHLPQIVTLIESLRIGWADRDDFYVGGDMFLYFSLAHIKKNDFRGPDLFVVLDTDRHRPRKSWVLWKERRLPSLIIELLSDSTEKVDRGEKRRVYAEQLSVDDYFLYRTETGRLEGFHLGPDQVYQPLPLGPEGRIWSPALGLWLGPVSCQWDSEQFWMLRWFDEAGRMLPTQAEQERLAADRERWRADLEQRRADQERRRADQEQRRAAEAVAELERAREQVEALERRLAALASGGG